jgi:hypothetical protein
MTSFPPYQPSLDDDLMRFCCAVFIVFYTYSYYFKLIKFPGDDDG